MKKILLVLFTCFLILGCLGFEEVFPQPQKEYQHVVLLGDPHLPGRNISLKQKAIENINQWADVDFVVVLGDLCGESGTVKEYEFAKKFLLQLNKPLYPIVGNRDYLYEDKSPGERYQKAFASVRKKKLQRFRETFSLREIYYSLDKNPYLLFFLSADHLKSDHRSHISEEQLKWLKIQLSNHKSMPTIIFFHAPLQGTLTGDNEDANNKDDMAQPIKEIRQLILDNPQIFIWASGHTHLAPTNSNFNHPVNLYEKRVVNIHNPDMDGDSYLKETEVKTKLHEDLWTNSLLLYPNPA